MNFEANENSISEDASIASTSTKSQQLQPPHKRAKMQVRPNMSCGVNVSANKICYLSYIYRI